MLLFYICFSDDSLESVHIMSLSTFRGHTSCSDYLDTVYMDLFEIEYYWCRFEFARSRGRIHAHLFAIKEDITDNNQENAMNTFSTTNMPDVCRVVMPECETKTKNTGEYIHSREIQSLSQAEIEGRIHLQYVIIEIIQVFSDDLAPDPKFCR